MPAKIRKKGDRFRIVEPSGKLVRNNSGTPVDGGGHATMQSAKRQQAAINTSESK